MIFRPLIPVRSKLTVALILCGSAGLFCPVSIADSQTPASASSVLEIMLTLIVPATDTLWQIDPPLDDSQWVELENAAGAVIDAIVRLRSTGGEQGEAAAWSEDQRWQAYLDEMGSAAQSAQDAAAEKNLEALETAGYAVYPPCEGCHLLFNPGVKSGL
jgi:hypothetical protein